MNGRLFKWNAASHGTAVLIPRIDMKHIDLNSIRGRKSA